MMATQKNQMHMTMEAMIINEKPRRTTNQNRGTK